MQADQLIAPMVNLGAVGICLIALSIYYIKKDRKYETRIDERFAQEREFRQEQVNQQEKYRLAMEKFGATLDSVVRLMEKRSPGGGA